MTRFFLDFEMKRRQIQSLESRLRYISIEIKNKLEQIKNIENNLEVAESELNNIQVSFREFLSRVSILASNQR